MVGYIDVEPCSEKYKSEMMLTEIQSFYPSPLCMKDEGNLAIKSNYETSSDALQIGYHLLYCRNTTENSNWCKSKDEVDAWLRERNSIFLYEETRVNKELWADSPQYEGQEDYFPTVKSLRNYNWGPIEVDK